MRKCQKCGAELSLYAEFCRNCGTSNPHDLARNKFVTFWIWLGIVVNAIATIGYFLLIFSSKGSFSAEPEPLYVRLLWLCTSAIVLTGYILLLKWHRIGFELIIVAVILSLFAGGVSSIFSILGVIILYLILRIKKGDISYWDAMGIKSDRV